MSGEEVLIPITLFGGVFAMTFGIVYLKTRENLAMVEKGMNPRVHIKKSTPMYLKWAMLLIGAGLGLLTAHLLDNYVFIRTDNVALYFSFIAIGGGLGLISSYRIDKKEAEKQIN